MSSVPAIVLEDFSGAVSELNAIAAAKGWDFTANPVYMPFAHRFKEDSLDLSTAVGDQLDLKKVAQYGFYAQTCEITHPTDKTSGGYPVTLKVDLLCATKGGEVVASSGDMDSIMRTAKHHQTRPQLRAAVEKAFDTKWMYV